jgi:hypothetical protein
MALNADEDEDLRVLTQLEPYGEFPPLVSDRLSELRARDRRGEVREPQVVAEWLPRQRRSEDAQPSADG